MHFTSMQTTRLQSRFQFRLLYILYAELPGSSTDDLSRLSRLEMNVLKWASNLLEFDMKNGNLASQSEDIWVELSWSEMAWSVASQQAAKFCCVLIRSVLPCLILQTHIMWLTNDWQLFSFQQLFINAGEYCNKGELCESRMVDPLELRTGSFFWTILCPHTLP